jgi:NAD-dependent dihydropyrimidine dehydrogenase PreA subunit
MREPTSGDDARPVSGIERRRLGWLLVLLPLLVAGGAYGGSKLNTVASQLNPAVMLAERYVGFKARSQTDGDTRPLPHGFLRVEAHPDETIAAALAIRRRFVLPTILLGGWIGLVIGVKLIALCVRQKRAGFEPDPSACFACARCFSDCPEERVRLGLGPKDGQIAEAEKAP